MAQTTAAAVGLQVGIRSQTTVDKALTHSQKRPSTPYFVHDVRLPVQVSARHDHQSSTSARLLSYIESTSPVSFPAIGI